MLWTPYNDFQWSANNFGSTYSTTAFGTEISIVGQHTKSTDAEIMSGASITEDVYGIAICFAEGDVAGEAHVLLCDIKADPAGGTAWTTIIPNLISVGPNLLSGGYWYYFPLFIKAGTSLAASAQSSFGSQPLSIGISVIGKPSRPELCKVGSFVRAYGPSLATSQGLAVTPGNQVMGSYSASLATTADDLWWWQAGLGCLDASVSKNSYYMDVAAGDATNKVMCIEHIAFSCDSSERWNKSAYGTSESYRFVKAGANVYVKVAAVSTPDTDITCAVYGLGG